jgi:sugar-specific transcriptional regulator TrmB
MQIEQIAARLEQLGLSGKEARVYVANLFLGPSSVQKIAEQAQINRPTTYVILDQLAEQGLVSQSKETKKTLFIAEPPETLSRLFEHQKQVIQDRQQELKSLLPELKQVERTQRAQAPTVRFYRGIEGFNAIDSYLKRQSRPKAEIYAVTNVDEVLKIFPDILKQNPEYRIKKQLPSKLIYSYSKGEVASSKKMLRTTKKMPGSVKADITLYDTGATLLTYQGKDSIGIVIESKEIVGALRQLFELAWKNQ